MLSILAGFIIAVGGLVYLSIGGIAGSLLFACGLMTVLYFKFKLFTGKAGLLVTQQINISELIEIWIGNFIGTGIVALLILNSNAYQKYFDAVQPILETRNGNGFISNLIFGFFCGVLMYIAVQGFKQSQMIAFIFIPVAVFILCGFNHCVADMFYIHMGASSVNDYMSLIPTTIGNIIGCNFIPGILILETK